MADSIERDVAVSGKTKRILSFDIIRGFLMLVILVGHIELPPNFYDFFTGRGRLFVSAAEGFFFLSGLLVGMVYRRRLVFGMKFIAKKIWTRAFELYVGSVIMTLFFSFVIAKTNHFYIKSGLPNPVDWHDIITRTLLLRFEYGWADFLGRFAILMFFAPFVFYLISKGKWRWLLAAMAVGWYFRGQSFTLAWQPIFYGGMVVGYYWKELQKWVSGLGTGRKKLIRRSAITITAIIFSYAYAVVYILSELNTHFASLSPGLKNFTNSWDSFTQFIWTYGDKWTMGPIRLILFAVWASVLYMIVSKREQTINRRTRGVLVLLGQNSLFVYIFHSLIVLMFKFFIPARTNALQNFAITSLALILLISGTYLYRYLRLTWLKTGNYSFWRTTKDRLQISDR
jgi:hypothetical protein